jgi:hypothetical protein
MLYPFVKKLPKGHIDENQQQAASSMERQISGWYRRVRLLQDRLQAAERLVRFVPDYELQNGLIKARSSHRIGLLLPKE